MKLSKIISVLFVFSTILGLVSVSYASTGRFSSHTVLYTVTTQVEADALPKIIEVTDGERIAILVDGNDIVLSGLTISGVSGAYDNINIAVDGCSNVEIKDCVLTGAYSSIYFYASSGKVIKCDVSGYVKNGITSNLASVDGDKVQISENVVTGSGPVGPGSWAQNGIQIGYGAAGIVLHNTVNGNWYTGDDWGASGILIFESSDCLVQGNTVTQCEMGIAIETWSWFEAQASNNKIMQNTITDGVYAITVSAYDVEGWYGAGYTMDDPTADNVKVVNNLIINQEVGVSLTNWDSLLTNDYETSVDNCKVVRNSFVNVATNIEQYLDTTTKIRANTP